jgi:hypothetical protein
MAKTKATNSHAKAQAEATTNPVQIVGSDLVITIPLAWNGKEHAKVKYDGQPDSERSKRLASIHETLTVNGLDYRLGINVTLPPDVKVTEKQRLKAENEAQKAEIAELKALKRMV